MIQEAHVVAESQIEEPEIGWMRWFLSPVDFSLPHSSKASPLMDEEQNCTCSSSFTVLVFNPRDKKSLFNTPGTDSAPYLTL